MFKGWRHPSWTRFGIAFSLVFVSIYISDSSANTDPVKPAKHRKKGTTLIHQDDVLKKVFFPKIFSEALYSGRRIYECIRYLSPDSPYERLVESKDYENLLALKRPQTKNLPENFLTFLNDDASFLRIAKNKWGFCAGMTNFTKKMMFLGFFDPSNVAHEVIPSLAKKKEWISFYSEKLLEIDAGHATSFPGFRNLNEITSNPELSKVIKRIVTGDWGENAVTPQSIMMYFKALKPSPPKELARTLANLKIRSDAGEMPRILFSAHMPHPNRDRPIHSLMVRKVKVQKDKTTRIYVWETNIQGVDQLKNPPYLEVRQDGSLFYEVWRQEELEAGEKPDIAGKVVRLIEFDEDFRAMADFAGEIRKFCEKKPELCSSAVKSELPSITR